MDDLVDDRLLTGGWNTTFELIHNLPILVGLNAHLVPFLT